MNEFDRFVRHQLKPQAYLRCGDDFVLFWATRWQAHAAKEVSLRFLADELGLVVNPKNDVIVKASSGLKFLGHAITSNFAVVDRHTTKNVLSKVDWHNAASYRSLYLVKTVKNSLDWTLLEKYVYI